MLMKVLKAFPYAHDHHHVVTLAEGAIVEIDEDVAGGLEDEGYIAEPTADEIEAAQSGCVVIEAPVEIPAGWAKLNAAEAVKLARALGAGPGVKSKASAADYITDQLARRAAA
jgi:hypothetical protein